MICSWGESAFYSTPIFDSTKKTLQLQNWRVGLVLAQHQNQRLSQQFRDDSRWFYSSQFLVETLEGKT